MNLEIILICGVQCMYTILASGFSTLSPAMRFPLIITYHINVRPVFPSPLYRSVSMISCSLAPCSFWTEKTVENTRIPHIKLTILLKNGVMQPSFTAPWVRRMKVAKVRKVPRPAPVILQNKLDIWLLAIFRVLKALVLVHANSVLLLANVWTTSLSLASNELNGQRWSQLHTICYTCVPGILCDGIKPQLRGLQAGYRI